MSVKIFGETHTGRVRSKNQDSFFFNELQGLVIVCDGIGGRSGGEIASSLATDSIRHAYTECDSLHTDEVINFLVLAIDQANRKILQYGQRNAEVSGLGTTVNALLFIGNTVYIGHVGDSRTYLFWNNHLWQLTVDHSIEVYIKKGWLTPQALKSGSKPGALVRALGLTLQCEPDIYEKTMTEGEIYLTCSDGLTGMVGDRRICEIIQENQNQLEHVPRLLIAEANRNGGKDNITVVISKVGSKK